MTGVQTCALPIYIDYAGPFHGYYFLVVVDSTTKWLEVFKTKSISAETTISLLRSCFARLGLPAVLVSDNGTSFTSATFKSYISSLGVNHVTTPVYSPSCNGAAERAVRTFKEGFHIPEGEGDIQKVLDQFLFRYRVTPHSTTGVSPTELMFGRRVRTVFDVLQPSYKVQKKVQAQTSKMQNRSKGKI